MPARQSSGRNDTTDRRPAAADPPTICGRSARTRAEGRRSIPRPSALTFSEGTVSRDVGTGGRRVGHHVFAPPPGERATREQHHASSSVSGISIYRHSTRAPSRPRNVSQQIIGPIADGDDVGTSDRFGSRVYFCRARLIHFILLTHPSTLATARSLLDLPDRHSVTAPANGRECEWWFLKRRCAGWELRSVLLGVSA
jgi:hypothetical protein